MIKTQTYLVSDPDQGNSMTLAGVVSWGFGCAGVDALGIYAEVSHFTSWLEQQMPDLNTCPPYFGGNLPNTTTESSTTTTTTTPTTTTTITTTTTTAESGNI